MSDDRFLEVLKQDAAPLRYTPGPNDPVWTRLPARVRGAIDAPPATLAQLLAAWIRPLGASLAALALAASLSLGWLEWRSAAETDLNEVASIEIGVAGDAYDVGN